MTDDEIKEAEKRGYSRGYLAGKKRKATERYLEHRERARQAFRLRVFLAALPAAIQMQGWTSGEGKPITTRDDRITFAWGVADKALERF